MKSTNTRWTIWKQHNQQSAPHPDKTIGSYATREEALTALRAIFTFLADFFDPSGDRAITTSGCAEEHISEDGYFYAADFVKFSVISNEGMPGAGKPGEFDIRHSYHLNTTLRTPYWAIS